MKAIKNILVIIVMLSMILISEKEGLIVVSSTGLQRIVVQFGFITVLAIVLFNIIKIIKNKYVQL